MSGFLEPVENPYKVGLVAVFLTYWMGVNLTLKKCLTAGVRWPSMSFGMTGTKQAKWVMSCSNLGAAGSPTEINMLIYDVYLKNIS